MPSEVTKRLRYRRLQEPATAKRTGALSLPETLNHRSAVQRNDLLGLGGPVHEG